MSDSKVVDAPTEGAGDEPQRKKLKVTAEPGTNGKEKGADKHEDDEAKADDDSNDSTGADANGSNSAESSEDSNQADGATKSDEGKKKFRVPASTVSGTVLVCGQLNWDMTGRKSLPAGTKGGMVGRCLYSPHRFTPLQGVKVRSVISGCMASHNVLITQDGKALTFGRNERGQLGSGDMERRDVPAVVEELKEFNIVAGSCGKNHTLLLTDRGTVFAFGDNKSGQCGVGGNQQVVMIPTKIARPKPIVKVACGAEFSMIVDIEGHLYSFGLPEYGQLGHNSDGKYFVTSSKLAFHLEFTPRRVPVFVRKSREGVMPVDHVEIKDLACGQNHTVALDTRGRVYTWGFGGYGRLGHNEPKDELIPRLLEFFDGPSRGAKMIAAGSSFSLAVSALGGTLMMWGATKKTGEANMYPKPIQDLAGWNIREMTCGNTSIGVLADDSTITWGPSPCYGELGLGLTMKTSPKPKEVGDLEDVKVHSMAMGNAHSMFLVADESDADKAALDSLPNYDPEETGA